MTGVLIRGREDTQTYRHTGRKPCDEEAESAVTQLQTKEHQGLPSETGREAWNCSSFRASRGTNLDDTLILDF